jgi:hypothetical protein
MNSATMMMYRFTVAQYDNMDESAILSLTGADVRHFWLSMMEDFSEEYDVEWYPLIATQSICATIDWSLIAVKYAEKRMIQDRAAA